MHKLRTPTPNTVSASVYQVDHLGTSRLPIATGGPVLTIDLPASVFELQREGTLSGNRNAITLVKHRDFRLVLSVMKAGTKLARHNVHGTVLIHVLSGHIRTEIFDASLHATAGQIISLDPNMEHEVKAVEDTALLITIAWPQGSLPPPATSMRQIEPLVRRTTGEPDESVWD